MSAAALAGAWGAIGRAWRAVCRRYQKLGHTILTKVSSWWKHGGFPALAVAVLAFAMLPSLPPMKWFYSHVVSVFTLNGPLTMDFHWITIRKGDHSDAVYQWQIWGLSINAISLFLPAFRIFIPKNVTRTERGVAFVYWLAFCASVAMIIFINYVPSTLYVLVLFYLLYVFTDIIGLLVVKTDYERAKYAYPLCCLDAPSLLTAIILLFYANTTQLNFLEGMAAGHLIFGSIAYLWIMGGVVPSRLGKLAPNGVVNA